MYTVLEYVLSLPILRLVEPLCYQISNLVRSVIEVQDMAIVGLLLPLVVVLSSLQCSVGQGESLPYVPHQALLYIIFKP